MHNEVRDREDGLANTRDACGTQAVALAPSACTLRVPR